MSAADECKRCARKAECGKTFQPRIDWGECGHCDGCMNFEPIGDKDADIARLRAALQEAVDRICDRDGDCEQCVRDGRFDCPARRWKAVMKVSGEEETL